MKHVHIFLLTLMIAGFSVLAPSTLSAQFNLKKTVQDIKKGVSDVKGTVEDIKRTKEKAQSTKEDVEELFVSNKKETTTSARKKSRNKTTYQASDLTTIKISNIDFNASLEVFDFLESLKYLELTKDAMDGNILQIQVQNKQNTRTLLSDLIRKSGMDLEIQSYDDKLVELKLL